MMILFLSKSFKYLLLIFAYQLIAWHIPLIIFFSTIHNTSVSVNRSDFTLLFFKAACHANPGAEEK